MFGTKTKMVVPLLLALMVGLMAPGPADADRRRAHNTMAGAVIGSGVGYLVSGSKGASAGAVVGAIAGYNK